MDDESGRLVWDGPAWQPQDSEANFDEETLTTSTSTSTSAARLPCGCDHHHDYPEMLMGLNDEVMGIFPSAKAQDAHAEMPMAIEVQVERDATDTSSESNSDSHTTTSNQNDHDMIEGDVGENKTSPAASRGEGGGGEGGGGGGGGGGEAIQPPAIPPLATTYAPVVTVGAYAAIGRRDAMEDRHVVATPACGAFHLAAVFDGHRGFEAAEFARVRVLDHLWRAWGVTSCPNGLLRRTFLDLDAAFLEWEDRRHAARVERSGHAAAKKRRYAGATALLSIVIERDLLVANAGDCRAVLCHRGRAVPLTRDHTANADAAERRRIEAHPRGRLTQAVDGYRVGSAQLQITRSLGDHDAKREGIIAEPEVTRHALRPGDEFVVLATDGVGCPRQRRGRRTREGHGEGP